MYTDKHYTDIIVYISIKIDGFSELNNLILLNQYLLRYTVDTSERS